MENPMRKKLEPYETKLECVSYPPLKDALQNVSLAVPGAGHEALWGFEELLLLQTLQRRGCRMTLRAFDVAWEKAGRNKHGIHSKLYKEDLPSARVQVSEESKFLFPEKALHYDKYK
ncbi:hypothetical protein AV530_005479 [Patagioenas fasciata monilis]|uniref:Uncharacterized protein n=1 Tax=Patagioenas fasciata monilis TaxID=372326 RepID=A0A1V4JMT8_PATFA|nr:hypothetical protein AV530_005479 [Patagioenas fasciata monilis]